MLFSSLTYPQLNALTTRNVVLVLPLGAVEQHGPHLGVATDTDIVSMLAAGTEQSLETDVLLLPTLPFGSSHHHRSFGGTVSIDPATYTQIIIELVESLLGAGFRRIVLLNGHGGNIAPVKQALSILSYRYDAEYQPNIALITYWELAGKTFAGGSPLQSPALSHACEYETSLMLHLFPERVQMDAVERAQRPGSNGYIPWEDDEPYRGVTLFKQTEFISSNGSSGEPQLATAKKGKHLFTQAHHALVDFISQFKTWPLIPSLKP